MSQETLKTLRIIVPGLIIFSLGIPLFNPDNDVNSWLSEISFTDGSLYLILVFFLGGIYHILNFRGFFLKNSLKRIQDNIKDKLLYPFNEDEITSSQKSEMRSGRVLIQIFYDLIDNNQSLQQKAKNVYFNGIFWSSVADYRALSLLFAVIYFIGWFLCRNREHYIIMCAALLITYIIATIVLLPIVTNRHINLSNEQLEYIQIHLRAKLYKLITQAIPHKRNT